MIAGNLIAADRHQEIAAPFKDWALPQMSYKTLFAVALIALLSSWAQPGTAQQALHPSWPIQNGFNRQPTGSELRSLHEQDVPPADAREIDRLYDELMRTDGGTHHPGTARMR